MPSLNRRFSDLLVVGITSNDLASGAVTAADLGTIYTGNITEDGANLYFTNARAQAAISPLNYATNNYVDVSLANLVNSAPAALNTLFELSAALGNDASFASTVTNALASKADSNSLTTANVTEITNLYFSNARSRAAITAGNTLVYAEATGNITMSISGVTAGTYGGATQAAALVVDKFGRVTSASNVAISGGSGSPGGSSGQVQYNSSGTFAGSANLFWDDTNGRLGIGTSSPAVNLEIKKNNGEALRLAATGANQSIYTRYIGGSPSVADFYVGVDTAAAGLNGQVGSAGMLWNAGNAGLAFGTNNTFRMAIDSSGIVGIGILPSAWDTSANTKCLQVGAGSLFTYAGAQTDLSLNSFYTGSDYRRINADFASRYSQTVGTHRWYYAASSTAGSIFAWTEAARITSAGDVLIGASSVPDIAGARFFSTSKQATVNGDIITDQQTSNFAFNTASGSNNSGATTCYLARYATAAAINPGALFKGYQDSSIVIKINYNGNVTNANNSYGSLSDAKLKENIVDAASQWDDIKSLRVRNYNFKEETGYQTNRQIGLIAQEAELISPGLVNDYPSTDNEVTKTINYSILYMKAVKALQEAMDRIETLEVKVAALEGN